MTVAALQALIDEETPGVRRLPAPRLKPRPSTGGTTVDTHTAVAVSMYKDGETVAAISEATGLTQDQIGAAVASAGTVFVADRETAPAPSAGVAQTEESAAEELIAWGMKHPSGRVRRLAGQARTALADLQQTRRREAVVSAAEDRVREAKQQLADAERSLRAAKGNPAATAVPTAEGGRPGKAESALIRAWAREHGHPVAVAGIIPRHLVDAYRAAQGEADRAA